MATSERCAGYGEPSGLQYCTTARLAYPLDPNAALIEDIPSVYAPGLTTILSDKISGMVPDKALGLTKMAGLSIMNSFLHFLMIIPLGICAALGKGPKWSAVGALGASGGTLFGLTVALGMWISAMSNLRSRVNGKTLEAFNHVPLGIDVQIGNAIWLLFMIDLHVLAGTILFALVSISKAISIYLSHMLRAHSLIKFHHPISSNSIIGFCDDILLQ